MKRFPFILIVLVPWLLAAAGCSSSDSSGSFSKSSSSLSESSSPTSGVGKEKLAYRDDVANLTYSISGTGLSADEFPQALARTARRFKISNWAGEKATFQGIGRGLKKAGIPRNAVGKQPFLARVLTANPNALKWIQDGYSD